MKKSIKEEKMLKCGMVSIVGRPNVGKSTLLNNILGEKVAIVSKVPQTTRNQIRGIYNDERGQIIFIDTPGIHMGRDKLDQYMNRSSTGTMQEADCIIYLVDTSRHIGKEEEMVGNNLHKLKTPVILGLNKIDLKGADVSAYISHWEKIKGKAITEIDNFTMIALSGLKEINLDQLLDVVFDYLPEGPLLYPVDTICDVPQKMAIADVVREKLFRQLKDELPHSLGVFIEHMQPVRHKTLMIKALVFVERQTQKEIVIGKKGDLLKKIGTLARKELEDLLGTKVYLEMFVKVQKNWRGDMSLLQELGYEY